MKHRINYLGFLSLLAFISILGWTTENQGLYVFFRVCLLSSLFLGYTR